MEVDLRAALLQNEGPIFISRETLSRFYVSEGEEGIIRDLGMMFFFNDLFSIFSSSNGPKLLDIGHLPEPDSVG